jgi:hypothetical protein
MLPTQVRQFCRNQTKRAKMVIGIILLNQDVDLATHLVQNAQVRVVRIILELKI